SLVASVSLSHPVVLESVIQAGMSFAHNDYLHPNSRRPDHIMRDDKQYRYFISLSRVFAKRVRAFASFSWTRNESTIGLFDYSRRVLSCGVSYEF
ncbi:hypothetical protein ACFL42_04725, partial [Candidatus Omnitrophota bacterium]